MSRCLDYKYKIKGVLVAACTRALRRPADGNLVYQITRSVPIAVTLMACTTEMIVTEICEPTSITDEEKLWAAFVTGYTSRINVLNVRPSHDISIPQP